MRIATCMALAATLLFTAPYALADEAPDFTAESLIFVQDDLPSGWKLLDSEDCPAELPNEEQVSEAGGDDVDAFELTVEYRLIGMSGGGMAVVAIMDADLEGGPAVYTTGLKALAAPGGWKIVELGHPQRVMLVAGTPEKMDEIVAWQTKVAAQKLALMAYDRLLSDFQDGKSGKLSIQRATEYADAALKLKANMPAARAIHGVTAIFKDDKDGGIKTLKGALAASGDLAPTARMKWFGWGMIDRTRINDTEEKPATAAENKEAVAAFRTALQYQDAAIAEANERNDPYLRLRVWGTRYNLCCGLVRIGDKDSAFKELETCMTVGKRLLSLGKRWGRWFEHAWFWDKDLEPVRQDPRFMTLMKKHAPDQYDWTKRTEELQKAKKKSDEEKAKQKAQKAKADKEKEKGGGASG